MNQVLAVGKMSNHYLKKSLYLLKEYSLPVVEVVVDTVVPLVGDVVPRENAHYVSAFPEASNMKQCDWIVSIIIQDSIAIWL